MSIRSLAALLIFLAIGARDHARAQCQTWSDGFGTFQTGLDDYGAAFTVFDDGNGPALIAGGNFVHAGGVTVNFIARWDGTSWSSLGGGTNGGIQPVTSLGVFDDGSGRALYAGGDFTVAGGVPASHIARWDGAHWSAVGGGMNYGVDAMAVFDDGTGPALYAGGRFDAAGGGPANRIAKWDGASWTPLGGGITGTGSQVLALTVFDDGSGPALYAAGYFDGAGGVAANNIAKWNGSSWSPLASGTNNLILALGVFDDGTGSALYAGGWFNAAGGSPAFMIARWNGSAWSAVGTGMTGSVVLALTTFDDGTGPALYAGGEFFQAGGVQAISIARWNGSAWSSVAGGLYENSGLPPNVRALAVFDDLTGGGPDLWAGGEFERAGTLHSEYIAKYQGCTGPGTSLCFGDGAVAACPCGNSGLARHGCKNSTTTEGAALLATGTTSPDTVVLQAFGELPSALSIFLQGTVTITPAAFGDGLRCTGGDLRRLYVKSASSGAVSAPGPGDLSITARSAALGAPIPPGHRRYYQVYYRDGAPGFCPPPAGGSFNVTNAVKIVW